MFEHGGVGVGTPTLGGVRESPSTVLGVLLASRRTLARPSSEAARST